MRSTTSPFWKMRTVPDDWLTAMATALVLRLMAAAAQWREPSPLLNVMPFGQGVDVHAGRLGDAVAADDDGSVQLRQVLDLLAHLAVAHVALVAAGSP